MISIQILLVLLSALIVAAVWFTLKRQDILNNHLKRIKYLPLSVAVATVCFVTAATIYYKIKQEFSVRELEELSLEAKKLDTSFQRIESTSQPSDVYSSTKSDSIFLYMDQSTSLSHKLTAISNDLLASNIFSKIKPNIKDSINIASSTLNDIKQSLEQTSKDINKNNVPHGFVFAGNIADYKWRQNNFRNQTNRGDTLAKLGDTLIVTRPIFVRSGETHSVEGKGWVNQQLLGTLQPGKKIIVKQLVVLPKNFVWIRY